MDERTLDSIFSGYLDDLPPVMSKIVRIFTSSTFTDMSMERNCLMENVYPKIKEYCKEKYGLEFQVVDMRWGVRDEATDDHMTTQLCMNEIKNCQRLSVGPNFVTFLGQKYGYRPIPTYIEAKEFTNLCDALKDLQISEVDLLYTWYKEDTNAIPSTFILQPISSILIHFNNKKEPELMAKDQSTWWSTLTKLQKVLRIAACHLHSKGIMNDEEKHNYIMSVTEREVINGVLKLKETRNTCLAYVRHISKINMTNVRQVNKFIDLIDGDVDQEASDLLADLRDRRLVKKIHPENIIKFKLNWSDRDGLNEDAHYEYLCEFINHFYKHIIKLVRRAMRKEDSSAFGKIVLEILQHSHACNAVSRIFLGRTDELATIKEYICGLGADRFKRPLILHGSGGCGKTSLLAKAASLARYWIGKPKAILILRFMGTTPDSSSVIPALTSICQQLSYNYTLEMEQLPDDLIPLMFHYKQLLIHATIEQPLLIFLDSVDQLDGPSEVSLKLSWLTYELPEYVRIVVSTVSEGSCEEYDFLRRAMAKTDAIFLEVKTLETKLAIDIIETMLRDSARTLTSKQWDMVKATIDHCTLPIFLKLVWARVVSWKSYTPVSPLSTTVMDSIMDLFERVELQHGRTLVSYALSYITASKCGLSESELEDLISLDDIVLNDIYQYHLPPIRRIPPLLWTRIRSDLPNYLTERDADGVSVMNWYHRQFREASIIRYLSSEEQVEYFHSMIADYFIGTWGGGMEKPFKYTDVQKSRFGLESDEGSADRKVPLQPNVYYGLDGSVSRFNGRKFGELPFHLTRSKRFSDLYKMVLFKYEWLHSKLSCCPLQAVLDDFEDCKSMLMSMSKRDNAALREVQLTIDAIKLAAAILIQYPSMLAPQLVARLLPLKGECPNIASLLEQCDNEGVKHSALMPINHCLHTPGGPLMYSLEGHSFAVFDFILTSDNRYILSVSNKFLMWDLSTGEVSREVDPKARGIMQVLVITGDDKLALTYSNYNDVWALDILTGDVMCVEDSILNFTSTINGIAVSCDNKTAIVWCRQEWAVLLLSPSSITMNSRYLACEEVAIDAEILTINYENHNFFSIAYRIITDLDVTRYYVQSFLRGKKLEVITFYHAMVIVEQGMFVGTKDGSILKYELNPSTEQWDKIAQLPMNIPNVNNNNKLGNYNYGHTGSTNKLLAVLESNCSEYIVAAHLRGFRAYNVSIINGKTKYFELPSGIRNISVAPLEVVSRLVFTKFNQYAVAGIRRCLYIWSVSEESLLKIIDAHYGRIVEMLPLIVDDINAIATSSLDRTVKVWNIKNIFEQVYHIDRMELPIGSIDFSPERNLVTAVTRGSVGIWDLKTGKLLATLADSPIGAIVTHAIVSQNSNFLLAVETDHLILWDLRTFKVVVKRSKINVKFLKIIPKSDLFFVVNELPSKTSDKYTKLQVDVCEIINLEHKYSLLYSARKREDIKCPQVTLDGQVLTLPDVEQIEGSINDKDIIQVYWVSGGTFVHKIPFGHYIKLQPIRYKGKENVIAIFSTGLGYISEPGTGRILAKIARWNESSSKDGSLGLTASPRTGGLDLIELRAGSTVKVLLPKVSEGLVSYLTNFTSNDDYVYYYHGGKKTIRLFRLEDGSMIANYRLSAEAKVIESSPDGSSLIIGGADGSLIILLIADPKKPDCHEKLSSLPSRQLASIKRKDTKTPLSKWRSAAKMAKMASSAQASRRNSTFAVDDSESSKACVIS